MLTEEFLTSVSGPPVTNNTGVARDVGIYQQTLAPNYGIAASFKKSACPPHCLAASDTHIFAAQKDKAYVHVYSRLRGNQETALPLADRIRSILLVGDVLVLGTVAGHILLWEFCTGRMISTHPIHVQAISCMAATRTHLLTGSDDSNIHVWSLSRLLQASVVANGDEYEPLRTMSNHRGGVTSLVVSRSRNAHTSLCASAARDKMCVLWNHATGEVLRTLVFPSAPLCLVFDSLPRTLVASTEEGCIYVIDLFGSISSTSTGNNRNGNESDIGAALLGSRTLEAPSTLMKPPSPIARAGDDKGSPVCLALSYDGNTLLTGHLRGQLVRWSLRGHETLLANLNAPITNILFLDPFFQPRVTRPHYVVKPAVLTSNNKINEHPSVVNVQFEENIGNIGIGVGASRFAYLLRTPGVSDDVIAQALRTFDAPTLAVGGVCNAKKSEKEEDQKKEEENILRGILNELGSFAKV